MSIKTQRQQIQSYIVTHLSAISGVENVYTEFQRASSMSDVLDKFAAATADGNDTALQYWTVRRIGADLHTNETDQKVARRSGLHTWLLFELKLFYAYVESASEAAFQNLIDDVLDGFKEERSLGDWNTNGPLSMHNTIQDGYDKNIYWHMCAFRVTAIAVENDLNPH